MEHSRFRNDPASPFARGVEAMTRGQFEQAIVHFNTAAEAEEQRAEALSKRGVCRLHLGDPVAAGADFEAALQINPQLASALTNLGNLALEAGRFEDARALYDAAIAADPDYPLAHHNLAVLLKRQGKVGESVRELRLAAKLESRTQNSVWNWLTGRRRGR